MTKFCELTEGGGCCMGYFGFWVVLGVSISASQISGGRVLGKGSLWAIWNVYKRVRDVWIGC